MYNSPSFDFEIMIMKLKAFILGAEGVGKTELNKHLCIPGYVNHVDKKYFRSIAPDFHTVGIPDNEGIKQVELSIWDASGNPHFKTSIANIFYSGADFGLFCVDLSQPLNQQTIDEFNTDLTEFRTKNPNALLILVGTKSDIALDDSLQNARQQFAEVPFHAVVTTSAREEGGSRELFNILVSQTAEIVRLKKEQELQNELEIIKYIEEKSTILYARNRCSAHSSLYLALEQLNHEAKDLSPRIIKALGLEANALLDQLEDSTLKDKRPCINAFITNCNKEIKGEHYGIKSAVLTFAYTAIVTVIAAMIGFGIGFALGAWSGPGAFFTALAAGGASAVAVITGASICGIGTMGYTAHNFFKTTPVLSSIDQVAEKANEQDLLHFNEHSLVS